MGYDVEWVVEAHEGQDVETRHVLDGVFVVDAITQLLVGAHLVAQLLNAAYEVGPCLPERLAACLVAGVEHGAVGEDYPDGVHHLVAVGVGAAVHSRRVVHHDAAHHGALHRSRVRAELASVRLQQVVDALAYESGLQAYGLAVVQYLVFLPVLASHHEDGVAYRLSRQARARGAEGDRQAVGLSRLEDAGNLGLRVGTDDDLRHEAVEARVGAPGQATELVGVDPALRYEVAYIFQE